MADLTELHGLVPEEQEELRIALVMNGGVSLAVWIGGVANEINAVVRREGLYGRLLDFLASTARVDVISGTSAGGINGGLLALAQVFGADLAPLRGVWLDRGSFDELLRSPYERDPESLLRGALFFKHLREAFRQVKGARAARPLEQVPIDLTLTATLLHGQPNRVADDFGTVIADVNHRARFEFRRGPDVPPPDPSSGLPPDPFADERIDRWLALAARATASFPVAFEPLFCPVRAPNPPGVEGLLDMHGFVNFNQSRFLLDGGILDNKPLESAINAIYRQRAKGDVRRVLCYVVPFPGETAYGPADDFHASPSLGDVAVASLMTLPRVESISAQLEAIVEHNRLVRRKRQTRVAFAAQVKWAGVRPIAEQLFAVYRRRRLESAADYIVAEAAHGFLQASGGASPLGRRRREWLAGVLAAPASAPWVPDALPSASPRPDQVNYTSWSWGAFTVENIGEVMLDLLRRGLQLAPLWDAATREAIKDFRVAAYDIMADAPVLRERDREFWRARGTEIATLLQGEADPARQAEIGRRWADDAMRRWAQRTLPLGTSQRAARYGPGGAAAGEAPIREALGWLAFAMAGLVAAAAPTLHGVAAAAGSRARRNRDKEAADELTALLEFFAPAHDRTQEAVLSRLVTLDVVLYAVGSQREVRDQFVELVQISANVATAFDGPASAKDKLAGAQLSNFAAFYRRAWRANDWMFGRLDAAERLVRIILNPARILRLYQGRVPAARLVEAVAGLAVPQPGEPDEAARPLLARLWQEARPGVERELAFLDHDDYPLPEQLTYSVAALVPRLHLAILRDELPVVVGAVEDDLANGADATGPAAQFLREARRRVGAGGLAALRAASPEVLVELFRQCRIGEERFGDQVGSDLFTKTVTRALAVVATSLSSERAGLGRTRSVLRLLRYPMLVVDALAQSLVRRSRTGLAAFVTAVAAGGAVVGLELFTSARVPGTLASLGAIAFVGAVALLLRRAPRLMIGWVAFAIVVWLAREYLPGILRLAAGWVSGQ